MSDPFQSSSFSVLVQYPQLNCVSLGFVVSDAPVSLALHSMLITSMLVPAVLSLDVSFRTLPLGELVLLYHTLRAPLKSLRRLVGKRAGEKDLISQCVCKKLAAHLLVLHCNSSVILSFDS